MREACPMNGYPGGEGSSVFFEDCRRIRKRKKINTSEINHQSIKIKITDFFYLIIPNVNPNFIVTIGNMERRIISTNSFNISDVFVIHFI